MLHKVKEIFQKLFPSKQPVPLTFEAPYKVEPELKLPAPSTPEVAAAPFTPEVAVIEEPVVITKPKKPRTNQNGNRPKPRKSK
jgi:hypothetical protein